MRLLTREQSQAVDRLAIQKYNFTPEELIASAGEAISKRCTKIINDKTSSILVAVGPGNNGQDGEWVASHLAKLGYTDVKIWRSGDNLQILRSAHWILDGLFGTGLNRAITGEYEHAVNAINDSSAKIISIDIASGLDANTGQIRGVCVEADFTIAIGLAKPGFFLADGPHCSGLIHIDQICFPKKLLQQQSGTHYLFAAHAARALLPKRNHKANKSNHGRVHIFAGSDEYPGAAVLCSRAAARMGAGYVYLNGFFDVQSMAKEIPEVILGAQKIHAAAAVVVGPGLGVSGHTADLVKKLASEKNRKVVLDADALTALASLKNILLPADWILTPHAGELSRLTGDSAQEIETDRCAAALKAAQQYGCVVLLKGYHTVVSDGHVVIIVRAGNVALAKGGSGDVLSGLIGALLAQGLSALTAACLGAYVHGAAADIWVASGRDVLTMIPSDLLEMLPGLITRIRRA